MEFTVTIRCKNAKELQEATALLSRSNVERGVDDSDKERGVKEAGKEVAYVPSSDRTKRAYDALLKCQRVVLFNAAILEKWAAAFPHVDLAGEILKAEAWAESKNVYRSGKGWAKALNSWLGKAQDKARGGYQANPVTPTGVMQKTQVTDPAVEGWARE